MASPQVVTNADTQLVSQVKNLKQLEKQIAGKLGAQILDYLFLFDRETSITVNFRSIDAQTAQLMNSYLQTSTAIFNSTGLPAHEPQKELGPNFLAALRNNYLLRYLNAKMLYADYQFVRIPTVLEREMVARTRHHIPLPDKTYAISIPETILTDRAGNILWPETAQQEATNHTVKTYLSSFTSMAGLINEMYQDLVEITTRGMLPRLYEKEVLELNQQVLFLARSYFAEQVYKYLHKGYALEESKNNVFGYFSEAIKRQGNKLAPELGDLEQDLYDSVKQKLAAIGGINDQTATAIFDDYRELIIAYLKNGYLFPSNFYSLEFRYPHPKVAAEEKYGYLMDCFLLKENGEPESFPTETYHVEYTDAAKVMIFDAVTQGLVNPNFTLEEYLAAV